MSIIPVSLQRDERWRQENFQKLKSGAYNEQREMLPPTRQKVKTQTQGCPQTSTSVAEQIHTYTGTPHTKSINGKFCCVHFTILLRNAMGKQEDTNVDLPKIK